MSGRSFNVLTTFSGTVVMVVIHKNYKRPSLQAEAVKGLNGECVSVESVCVCVGGGGGGGQAVSIRRSFNVLTTFCGTVVMVIINNSGKGPSLQAGAVESVCLWSVLMC